jgi:hypothetical protein
MPLEKRFKKDFGLSTRNKGESYHRQGAVKVVSHDDTSLQARVKGSYQDFYEVELDWSEPSEGLVATCDCPHYDDGNFCKHLWATMLVADQQDLVSKDLDRLTLVHVNDDDSWTEDSWIEDDLEPGGGDPFQSGNGKSATRRLPSSQSKSRANKTQTWHNLLTRTAASDREARKPRLFDASGPKIKRVQFLIDVAASFHAGALTIHLYQQQQTKNGEWGKPKPL